MILTIINPKGGVGKTNICLNLGGIAAQDDIRTRIIDYDPKANLTEVLLEPTISIPTINDLLFYSIPFSEVCLPIQNNLFLVLSSQNLTGFARPEKEPLN